MSDERRSIGTIENLEAVLEEALADIIDLTEQLDRRPSVAGGGLSERNTHSDVVQSTGFQSEGASRLHETTVTRSVSGSTGSKLGPVVGVDGRRNAIGTPVPRVTIIGEHEVAMKLGRIDIKRDGVTTI